MVKWADYAITHVCFKEEESHILAVKAREDNGEQLVNEQEWSRQQVVSAIERGTTFVTTFKKEGKWTKGEDVHVVEIRGVKYIRTDKNSIEADNLGELPEY